MKIIIEFSKKNIEDTNAALQYAHAKFNEVETSLNECPTIKEDTSFTKKYGFGTIEKSDNAFSLDISDSFISKLSDAVRDFVDVFMPMVKFFAGKFTSVMYDFEEIVEDKIEEE